jgi:hypothetical protein
VHRPWDVLLGTSQAPGVQYPPSQSLTMTVFVFVSSLLQASAIARVAEATTVVCVRVTAQVYATSRRAPENSN